MDIMRERHSVRQYRNQKIETEKRAALEQVIGECNAESGLHIQIIYDEPKCFDSFMAHYGKFSGVSNYIALVGKKNDDLDETAGYYGERIVLRAQELGLNTCWVAMKTGRARSFPRATSTASRTGRTLLTEAQNITSVPYSPDAVCP